ncbi:hypothetical protein [Microbacterium halotolerans]|uniref:hypothetical protein n=1 Tax=Microbacterium halotolerans TaxID=246613 RepID=UPI00196969B2|nr:hypothetical protein [Microbacterium halotolerans]
MSTPPVPPQPNNQPGHPGQPPQGQPGQAYPQQPGQGYQGQGYPQQQQPGYYPAPPQPRPARPKGSPTLGIIAAVASVIAVIAGSVIVGVASTALAGYVSDAAGSDYSYTGFEDAEFLPYLFGIFAGFGVYGLFGMWGLIQGIVATVLNRGRGWGIAAIVISVVGIVPVMITYVATFVSSIPFDTM